MKVLVTGASGLVGNNVTRQLLEQSHEVRVLMRASSNRKSVEGLPLEIAHGDVTDAASVRAACEGVDAVVHAAGKIHFGWTHLDEMRAVNGGGTRNVAEAAHAADARLLHVSSVDALGLRPRGEPADEDTPAVGKFECPYVVTKREAERAVVEETDRGLDGIIVNPGFMLGPWDWQPSSGRMLLAVAKGFVPFTPSGGFSVCDVRDVAAAILTAIAKGRTGRRYILAGTNIRYYETWCLFAEVAESRKPWGRLGPVMAWLAGRGGDVIGKLTGREPDVNSAGIRMGAQYHYYSSQRAIDELGYRIRPPRESAVAEWEWLQAYGYA